MSFLKKLIPDANEKLIKSLQTEVDKINHFEPILQKLSDSELKAKTEEFKEKIKAGESLDKLLPEAFAVVREASNRVIKQRHYDVQLIGGIILHGGKIAEMKTGEGKTLVATLPLYLNALEGKGVHLITVNDYLAKIGAGWMAQVYYFLGLQTGVITHEEGFIYDPEYIDDDKYDERLKHFRPVSRVEAYNCDITYGTNNEFGFDYLRDNMVPKLDQMVQRDLHFAIVDEVDSILIDEARTPLIISAPAEDSTNKYFKFSELVQRFSENEDYNVDEKMRAATLTEGGIAKMEKWLGVENIYVSGGVKDVHHIEQALKARVLFKKDKDYVVKDGEVIIVDEFTGRLMPGRRYSEGLHQAIEAKEGLVVNKESQTLATVTFQNYFRMYKKLSGMTGTAATEAEEFEKIYKLETVVIPTNKVNIRKDDNDLIFRTEMGKYKAIIADIKERHALGQPVLVGTISIEKNEILAEMMEREGLHPQVLNAKNHLREAEIIAQAGKLGGITIATNMAGRGVDIILGGNPPDREEHEKVKTLGGLYVIGTERHESRRIDNQLRGRAARQGDPGMTRFYISADDDLMRIFGGDRLKNIMSALRLPEDMPINNRMVSRSIESAQKRVEGNNFDTRKHLVEYDDVINKHRETIYRLRRQVLAIAEGKETDKKLRDIILEMVDKEISEVISFHTAGDDIKLWNTNEIYEVMKTMLVVDYDLREKIKEILEANTNKDKARNELLNYFLDKAKNDYVKIEETLQGLGSNFVDLEKNILIRAVDLLWIEHLETMDYMRRGIGLRGYGQRDPLVEYKKEAYLLFTELMSLIQKQVAYSIFKIAGLDSIIAPNLMERAKHFSAPAKTANEIEGTVIAKKPKNEEGEKIGRNDLCPCGSGKKYKKCCGK